MGNEVLISGNMQKEILERIKKSIKTETNHPLLLIGEYQANTWLSDTFTVNGYVDDQGVFCNIAEKFKLSVPNCRDNKGFSKETKATMFVPKQREEPCIFSETSSDNSLLKSLSLITDNHFASKSAPTVVTINNEKTDEKPLSGNTEQQVVSIDHEAQAKNQLTMENAEEPRKAITIDCQSFMKVINGNKNRAFYINDFFNSLSFFLRTKGSITGFSLNRNNEITCLIVDDLPTPIDDNSISLSLTNVKEIFPKERMPSATEKTWVQLVADGSLKYKKCTLPITVNNDIDPFADLWFESQLMTKKPVDFDLLCSQLSMASSKGYLQRWIQNMGSDVLVLQYPRPNDKTTFEIKQSFFDYESSIANIFTDILNNEAHSLVEYYNQLRLLLSSLPLKLTVPGRFLCEKNGKCLKLHSYTDINGETYNFPQSHNVSSLIGYEQSLKYCHISLFPPNQNNNKANFIGKPLFFDDNMGLAEQAKNTVDEFNLFSSVFVGNKEKTNLYLSPICVYSKDQTGSFTPIITHDGLLIIPTESHSFCLQYFDMKCFYRNMQGVSGLLKIATGEEPISKLYMASNVTDENTNPWQVNDFITSYINKILSVQGKEITTLLKDLNNLYNVLEYLNFDVRININKEGFVVIEYKQKDNSGKSVHDTYTTHPAHFNLGYSEDSFSLVRNTVKEGETEKPPMFYLQPKPMSVDVTLENKEQKTLTRTIKYMEIVLKEQQEIPVSNVPQNEQKPKQVELNCFGLNSPVNINSDCLSAFYFNGPLDERLNVRAMPLGAYRFEEKLSGLQLISLKNESTKYSFYSIFNSLSSSISRVCIDEKGFYSITIKGSNIIGERVFEYTKQDVRNHVQNLLTQKSIITQQLSEVSSMIKDLKSKIADKNNIVKNKGVINEEKILKLEIQELQNDLEKVQEKELFLSFASRTDGPSLVNKWAFNHPKFFFSVFDDSMYRAFVQYMNAQSATIKYDNINMACTINNEILDVIPNAFFYNGSIDEQQSFYYVVMNGRPLLPRDSFSVKNNQLLPNGIYVSDSQSLNKVIAESREAFFTRVMSKEKGLFDVKISDLCNKNPAVLSINVGFNSGFNTGLDSKELKDPFYFITDAVCHGVFSQLKCQDETIIKTAYGIIMAQKDTHRHCTINDFVTKCEVIAREQVKKSEVIAIQSIIKGIRDSFASPVHKQGIWQIEQQSIINRLNSIYSGLINPMPDDKLLSEFKELCKDPEKNFGEILFFAIPASSSFNQEVLPKEMQSMFEYYTYNRAEVVMGNSKKPSIIVHNLPPKYMNGVRKLSCSQFKSLLSMPKLQQGQNTFDAFLTFAQQWSSIEPEVWNSMQTLILSHFFANEEGGFIKDFDTLTLENNMAKYVPRNSDFMGMRDLLIRIREFTQSVNSFPAFIPFLANISQHLISNFAKSFTELTSEKLMNFMYPNVYKALHCVYDVENINNQSELNHIEFIRYAKQRIESVFPKIAQDKNPSAANVFLSFIRQYPDQNQAIKLSIINEVINQNFCQQVVQTGNLSLFCQIFSQVNATNETYNRIFNDIFNTIFKSGDMALVLKYLEHATIHWQNIQATPLLNAVRNQSLQKSNFVQALSANNEHCLFIIRDQQTPLIKMLIDESIVKADKSNENKLNDFLILINHMLLICPLPDNSISAFSIVFSEMYSFLNANANNLKGSVIQDTFEAIVLNMNEHIVNSPSRLIGDDRFLEARKRSQIFHSLIQNYRGFYQNDAEDNKIDRGVVFKSILDIEASCCSVTNTEQVENGDHQSSETPSSVEFDRYAGFTLLMNGFVVNPLFVLDDRGLNTAINRAKLDQSKDTQFLTDLRNNSLRCFASVCNVTDEHMLQQSDNKVLASGFLIDKMKNIALRSFQTANNNLFSYNLRYNHFKSFICLLRSMNPDLPLFNNSMHKFNNVFNAISFYKIPLPPIEVNGVSITNHTDISCTFFQLFDEIATQGYDVFYFREHSPDKQTWSNGPSNSVAIDQIDNFLVNLRVLIKFLFKHDENQLRKALQFCDSNPISKTDILCIKMMILQDPIASEKLFCSPNTEISSAFNNKSLLPGIAGDIESLQNYQEYLRLAFMKLINEIYTGMESEIITYYNRMESLLLANKNANSEDQNACELLTRYQRLQTEFARLALNNTEELSRIQGELRAIIDRFINTTPDEEAKANATALADDIWKKQQKTQELYAVMSDAIKEMESSIVESGIQICAQYAIDENNRPGSSNDASSRTRSLMNSWSDKLTQNLTSLAEKSNDIELRFPCSEVPQGQPVQESFLSKVLNFFIQLFTFRWWSRETQPIPQQSNSVGRLVDKFKQSVSDSNIKFMEQTEQAVDALSYCIEQKSDNQQNIENSTPEKQLSNLEEVSQVNVKNVYQVNVSDSSMFTKGFKAENSKLNELLIPK